MRYGDNTPCGDEPHPISDQYGRPAAQALREVAYAIENRTVILPFHYLSLLVIGGELHELGRS